ncbi:hypothetical protein BGZ72_008601 [Mortierella alpina]|nr:hypothetical protein BGZ72_008601 [Mortierella alpina]
MEHMDHIVDMLGNEFASRDSAGSKGDDRGDTPVNLENLPKNLDAPAMKEALPSPQPQYRSYFKVLGNQTAHELLLRPVDEKQLPIAFKPTAKYLKWTIPTPSGVKSADYDIVLGISTKNLKLDAVEAIVFTFFHNIGDSPAEKSEVIASQELRRLCLAAERSEATCFRWKLHEKLILPSQKEEKKEDKSTMIVMEVKTWMSEPEDYGSIELHYIEIISDLKALYKLASMPMDHEPFIHTVDVNRTGCPQLDWIADEPMRITYYSISGDGSHILIKAVAGNDQVLQLWNFRSQPQLVAWMQLPTGNETTYDYCLSWDGSVLVCVDLCGLYGGSHKEKEEKSTKNATTFYNINTNYTEAQDKGIVGFKSFTLDEKKYPKLKDLSAKAVFHRDPQKEEHFYSEHFVTCDGVTIEVYRVYSSDFWRHRQSIAIDPTRTTPTDVCNALRHNLRGSYLAMRDGDTHQVSTWDINRGIRLSSCTTLTHEQMEKVNVCAAMSNDGNQIAIPGKHKVDVFLTATWTAVVSYPFKDIEHSPSVRSVQFIYNEEIMVALDYQQQPFYQQNRGFVLSANRASKVEEYITEGHDTFRTTFNNPANPRAICIGVSQVSLFDLENRAVQSPKRLKKRCSESCRSIDSFLSEGLPEATEASDLGFEAKYSTASADIHGRYEDLPVLVVTSKDGNDQQRLSISLPQVLGDKSAAFVNGGSQLLVSFNKLIMVWTAPTHPEDTFTLQLVHAVPHPTKWRVCSHRLLYGLRLEQIVPDEINLNDPIHRTKDNFLAGIAMLPLIFSNSNDVVQQEIIDYICRNINNSHCDVVLHVCTEWVKDTHIPTLQLWKAVFSGLAQPFGRWNPKPDMVRKTNPILHLLDKGKTNLEAFKLAEVFIDYCVRQAMLEKDPIFLLPVLQCLQELADPNKPYSEAALKLLRDLAYLRARDREAIISRHWIAHPFELRWDFWKPNPRGLDQYKNQVLHVTSAPTANSPKNSFSREIYLASFDMLWLRSDGDLDLARRIWSTEYDIRHSREFLPDKLNDLDDLIDDLDILLIKRVFRILVSPFLIVYAIIVAVAYFILAIVYCLSKATCIMMMRRFGMVLFPKVECHNFEPDALDNPAIAALVEYKWNTIGLRYWLLRFLAECVYYALVLVAIFMQIYRYGDDSTLRSIFIAIAAISAWFLWLELMQIIKYKHGYFGSVYNYVDLLAFLTPSVASLLQLNSSDFGAKNSLLSFSALFIFLHFLFELRVIRSVCKFVSIIIYAISSIRVFFFIFAGGILAFAIAISHVLHTCTDATTCPSYTEGFSFNLFRALSTTYFLMSGRYDPVSNGLTNNDVAIHVMLMVFFFFTVIVMMNVLIALINHAFDDGDKTWELDWLQNRMRFVESAENMSYDFSAAMETLEEFFPFIPSSWASGNSHPETIYFTATAFQVREYKKTTQNLKVEGFPKVGVTVDATAKSQRAVSKIYGGHGQNWQQSQQQEQEEVDANAGDNKASKAVTEMFDQILKEQIEKLVEQQEAYKALLAAHEEEKREGDKLRKELALFKGQ